MKEINHFKQEQLLNLLVSAGSFFVESGEGTKFVARDNQNFYDTLIGIIIAGVNDTEVISSSEISGNYAAEIAKISEDGSAPKQIRVKLSTEKTCSFLLADKPVKEYCLIKTTYSGKEIELAGWRDNGVSYCKCWDRLLGENNESCNDYVTPTSDWCVYDNSRVNQGAFSDGDFDDETPAYVKEVKQAAEMIFGELSGSIGDDNYYKFVEVVKP
jgi:hypothetical protein